jgi:inorganic pyrophosphatase
MNLLHSIKAYTDDSAVNVVIEVPAGSKDKMEYDIVDEKFVSSRILNSNLAFPFNYGFVPETWSTDNDPLDVMVLSSAVYPTGTQIKARIIGLLATTDQEGKDSKLITVPVSENESLFANLRDIADLDKQTQENIDYFYKNYKINEPGKWVDIDGYFSKKEAAQKLNEAIEHYHQHF